MYNDYNPPPDSLAKDILSPSGMVGLYSPRSLGGTGRNCVLECLDKGFSYLRREHLRSLDHLSTNDYLKPAIFAVIASLEKIFSQVHVLQNEEGVQAYSLQAGLVSETVRKLYKLINHTSEELVNHGYGIPRVLRWGQENCLSEWWNENDFEILCACYRQEIEVDSFSFT